MTTSRTICKEGNEPCQHDCMAWLHGMVLRLQIHLATHMGNLLSDPHEGHLEHWPSVKSVTHAYYYLHPIHDICPPCILLSALEGAFHTTVKTTLSGHFFRNIGTGAGHACLDHEVLDNSVKDDILVVSVLGMRCEILHSFGHCLIVEPQGDVS